MKDDGEQLVTVSIHLYPTDAGGKKQPASRIWTISRLR